MTESAVKSLNQKLENAVEILDSALSDAAELSREDAEGFYKIGTLGRAVGLIREFQSPILEKYPAFKSEHAVFDQEVSKPSEVQLRAIKNLTSEQIAAIDAALVSFAEDHFLKVAKIVGDVIFNSDAAVKGLPDVYYAQRVKELVTDGALVGQGDLDSMRSSEVRLPSGKE